MIDTEKYAGQTVAIAGYGLEGESALRYYQARGAHVVVLDESTSPAREIPQGVERRLGPGAFDNLKGFDIVSRTPPLNPAKLKTFQRMSSVTREFFLECPAPIIGVTGTKGKGTTTTLISEILKSAGHTVHLVGNVGNPALNEIADIKAEDIVCYELSSFQLWDLDSSPETAVVLMVEQDHLDTHKDMNDYIDAKKGIARTQQSSDLLIYHPSNINSAEIAGASSAKKVQYMTEDGAYIRGGDILINEQKICSKDEVGLRGPHNLENICAAITAAWVYTQDIESIRKAVTTFTGLEHRIEHIRDIDGIEIYNDSYSSAPLATQAAINSFPETTQILILGGKDKKGDYTAVFDAILEHDVREVVVYGENRQILYKQLSDRKYSAIDVVDGGIKEVFERAMSFAMKGDVVVFSPGTSSYDMFKNFKQRGEAFKKAVKEYES